MSWDDARAERFLRAMFDRAIAAVDPRRVLTRYLPPRPRGRCVVVGAGKCAAPMAAAVEAAWPDVPLVGAVVTRYGHDLPRPDPHRRIAVLEAGHPVPDANSVVAAERLLQLVHGLGPEDLVLALISGGGSAVLALPAPGLTLADKQMVTAALLASGATISEINTVRRRLSGIKGGRLAAAAAPARVVTLVVSDVPGDDPAVVASGPTVADPTPLAVVRDIITRYRIDLPPAVAAHLAAADGAPAPQPPPDIRIIATPLMALQAAAAAADEAGLRPIILSDALEGESRQLGLLIAGIARSVRRHGHPLAAPALLLSGGESTVTLDRGETRGQARGGRNTECLLAMALALGGASAIWALAADSDGIDGSGDAAGAIIGPDKLAHARRLGLDPQAMLARHDSYTLLQRVGALLRTGPTLTNVNDVRAVLIA